MQERKEEFIESEILCFFMEKWCKVNYKNDIKGFYDTKNNCFKRNKSNFIRNWISDITILRKGLYIAIEVKKPSEMKFFDKPLKELQEEYARAIYRVKDPKKYLHAIEQRQFLDDVIKEWWIWFFTHSLEHTKEKLKENKVYHLI